MHCLRCGKCCEQTEMLLSKADIELLEKSGHKRENFVHYDKQGFAKLKNHSGHCIFYDTKNRRCKAYRLRPEGCRIYPVIYSEEEGIVVDDICPAGNKVSNAELERKGRKVMQLLHRIDEEAKTCF